MSNRLDLGRVAAVVRLVTRSSRTHAVCKIVVRSSMNQFPRSRHFDENRLTVPACAPYLRVVLVQRKLPSAPARYEGFTAFSCRTYLAIPSPSPEASRSLVKADQRRRRPWLRIRSRRRPQLPPEPGQVLEGRAGRVQDVGSGQAEVHGLPMEESLSSGVPCQGDGSWGCRSRDGAVGMGCQEALFILPKQ